MNEPSPADEPKPSAPFAYEGLERVIHEKARLGILSSLVAHGEWLAFSELKQLCALTDGNLNRHLQVLQDAGLVDVRKDVANKRPQTLCRLTSEGRRRFVEYLGVLERIVGDAFHTRLLAAGRSLGKGAVGQSHLGSGPLGQGFSPA